MRLSNKLLGQGYVKERLKSSLRKLYGRYEDLTKQYEVPLSRMLHDILDDDHIQWHPQLIGHYTNFWPLLIWALLPNLTFYLIMRGFHRTFATGAACQQRTPTPPDTWSCPTLGLACVLMSRPISPELVLFPDSWVSNIPRYFSFALWLAVRLFCILLYQTWYFMKLERKLNHMILIFMKYKQDFRMTAGNKLQRPGNWKVNIVLTKMKCFHGAVLPYRICQEKIMKINLFLVLITFEPDYVSN